MTHAGPLGLIPLGVAVAAVVALALAARRPPFVTLELTGDLLRVRLGLLDRFCCLHGDLLLPTASIAGVAVASRTAVPRSGLRLPGTSVPGVIRAGSFGRGPRRDFWDVRRAESYLVVVLHPGGPYRRVVLEVPDPTEEAARLRGPLGSYEGTFR